jgi:hypothetical protein
MLNMVSEMVAVSTYIGNILSIVGVSEQMVLKDSEDVLKCGFRSESLARRTYKCETVWLADGISASLQPASAYFFLSRNDLFQCSLCLMLLNHS